MKGFLLIVTVFGTTGCFLASGSFHSQGADYHAQGLFGPSAMELAAADMTSAQADRVRAEGRALEAHPELFVGGRGYGYGGSYYGGGYGQTAPGYTPNYYTPYSTTPSAPVSSSVTEADVRSLEELAREIAESVEDVAAEVRDIRRQP